MQEFSTIEKDPTLEVSQDFQQLREAGLKHIEALGSQLWTDYNSHDPGITLLEVLAYAITDLGFRTGSDIKDILTEGSDEFNNHASTFHKATQILPCNQVTELDLREILIDVVGVRNAWIKITNSFENDYHVDFDNSELRHDAPAASVTQAKIESLNGLYHVIVEFDRLEIPIDAENRLEKEDLVLAEAKARLMQYRNFCEDYFIKIRSGEMSNTPVTQVIDRPKVFENIVIWADVEVESDANMEKVHAQIYFDIEQFLIPYVSFYSLKERLDHGQTIDEIFEGPLLQNGFIDEDQLEAIKLRETIHTSDLYQVAMDVPGVKAVKSMKVANYFTEDGFVLSDDQTDNELDTLPIDDITDDITGELDLKKLLSVKGKEWTLKLNSSNEDCLFNELVLETVTTDTLDDINRTIKFYTGENSVPVTLDTSKTLDELNILRQNDRKRRERLSQTSFELEVPTGEHLDLAAYYPAQNELPEVYGTGEAGLADEVTDERKAQAKQLKAFMLLFEQILTNYLAQLNNVRHLFSWDDTIDKTYYTQPLVDIKNRDELYLEQYDGSDLAPLGILDESRLTDLIQEDAETGAEYYDRRSRFLNHLIARFNEKFVDYTMVMHSMGMKDRVISDKASLLKEYDLISMNRGKGFDYSLMRKIKDTDPELLEPDVWDTSNVTGYQHRLCRFLGISDETRRFLYSGHNVKIEACEDGGVVKYRYVLLIDEESGLEVYGQLQNNDADAIEQFNELIENAGKDNIVDATIVDPLQFKLVNGEDDALVYGEGAVYATAAENTAAFAAVNAYFDGVASLNYSVSGSGASWNFSVEISDATPTFDVVGLGYTSMGDAETALNDFLFDLNANNLAFSMEPMGDVVDNKFFFNVSQIDTGDDIAVSEELAFVNDYSTAQIGMAVAEEFLNDSIGYIKSEGGLHVVEHVLLRPRTDNMSFFDVDVKQYDSIDTAENPPVAYPVDYDGIYDLEPDDDGSGGYKAQYFLSSEVELISPNLDNENGEKATILETYFETLSENQNDEEILNGPTWEVILEKLRETGANLYDLYDADTGSNWRDKEIWTKLVDEGYGCDYSNYVIDTVEIDGDTINYYFIREKISDTQYTILGGLALVEVGDINLEEVKKRALRANAYFCDNTTCKGVSNPYEFKATVVLPAWTDRAKDFNYREYAEEIIRLEAPAHVAVDIFWLSRSQMKDFELCYREWLMKQGEFLYRDRLIQADNGISETFEAPSITPEMEQIGITLTTDLSSSMIEMNHGANCLIETIGGLINVYQSIYKNVQRNDQYFDSPGGGSILAWISDTVDGSVVNQAEIVSGVLPDFLGFYSGTGTDDPEIPDGLGEFAAGDFIVLDNTLVVHGSWSFSVKTYSDTGQVSCADVTITIFKDLEAEYENHHKCYNHLEIGDIVSEIDDPNGLVSSASISAGTMPAGLKLLLNPTDLSSWASSHGLDPSNYQPGDIVVDDDTVINFAVNDDTDVLALSETNIQPNLVIDIVDITGGTTTLSVAQNSEHPGIEEEKIIHIFGNAKIVASSCNELNLGMHNLANTVYTTGLTDVLMTLTDGHAAEGITYVDLTASIVIDASYGIGVRVNTDGQVEIYVDDFAEFEIYVNGLTPDINGRVEIPIPSVTMIDSCDFVDTWEGTACVIQDRDPVVDEILIPCAGALFNTDLITITDADNGIDSYAISADTATNLAAIGVSHAIDASEPSTLRFKVNNSSIFLSSIQDGTHFPGTETIDGVSTLYFEFNIDLVDGYGTASSVTVRLYAPVNKPFECIERYPSGTSYLAYLPNTITTQSGPYGYVAKQTYPNTNTTVMSFTDDNGIQSISCSCNKCNGQPFGSPWVLDDLYEVHGVTDYAVMDYSEFGEGVKLYEPPESKSAENPVTAKKGSPAKRQSPSKAERGEKMMLKKNASHEKLVAVRMKRPGHLTAKPPTCSCLTNRGLALDKTNHRIYVANETLFRAHGIGTVRFSITITDKCGITSCKNVTLVIGDDSPAIYVDDKNKSYLNALSNGDRIGYPVDPDGTVVRAQLILYNETSKVAASPVNPTSLIPPGMEFNIYSGEIRVKNVSSGTHVAYETNYTQKSQPASSGSAGATKSAGAEAKAGSGKSGKKMFVRKSSPAKTNGIQKMTADSGQAQMVEMMNNSAQNSGLFNGGLEMELQSPIVTWLSAPGAVQIGKWTIFVHTTDVHGGTTIVKYVIEVKKSAIVVGVLDNAGYKGFAEVKVKMKTNYGGVLKAPVQATTQIDSISLDEIQQSVTTNKAQ